MKVCRTCQQSKPLADFYRHVRMLDGHLNNCIACVKARIKHHRARNIDKIREYDQQRGMLPHRVEARKLYVKTPAGKNAMQKAQQRYRERYPMKYAAHTITSNAIRDGVLVPDTVCSVCNASQNIEGHHDDYTKPLAVRWLCASCHKAWHRTNTPIYK